MSFAVLDPSTPRREIEIALSFPSAHSPIQAMMCHALSIPGLEEAYFNCGTKFGKSLGCATAFAKAATDKGQGLWRWVAPIYEQAELVGLDYVTRLLPPPPLTKVNRSDLMITIPGMDLKMQFRHGQEPVSLEGVACWGMVGDEAAKMKEGVYDSTRGTFTRTGGPRVWPTTPFGKNWYYKKAMAAKLEMERAKAEGRPPKQIYLTAPTWANPFIPKEAIEAARRDLPHRLFLQYYAAEFVDDSMVFPGFRDILYGEPIETSGVRECWIAPGAKERRVVISVDWAKKQDKTVMLAMDLDSEPVPRIIGFLRLFGMAYMDQLKQLVWFARQFRAVEEVGHDKTGVGEAIDEQLSHTELAYRGFIFTNASKTAWVNDLMLAVQQKHLLAPNWTALVDEADAYEVKTNDLGFCRYSAPSGGTDDIIASLLILWQLTKEYTTNQLEVRILEDLPATEKLTVASWYSRLGEETDDDEAFAGRGRKLR